MFDKNLILLTDSYKPSHYRQYPPKCEKVFSYFESRGGYSDETMMFGLQYILKEYLVGQVVTKDHIDQADEIFKSHLGSSDIFNRAGWEYILKKHQGRLPIKIRAVPEGSIVPVHNVLLTVENIDSNVPWLTNYLETLLSTVWSPCTVGTYSYHIKKVLAKYLGNTSTNLDSLPFKFHDFGFRGSSSVETAGLAGAAHLVNFLGSDTLAALSLIKQYYHGDDNIAYSVPAAEHSTITSWGRANEADAFRNMLQQFPTGIVAVVSDSYNIYKACETWGTVFKEDILNRQGTLVIRPDSGNPLVVLPKMLKILDNRFGHTINESGYKVLPDQVRILQGDGVDLDMIHKILKVITDKGWSAENLVFGCGGALLQKHNRDTHKFAFKCSAIQIDGEWHDVYKDPITDKGKRSKKGRLDLLPGYKTVRLGDHQEQHPDSILQTVFENGELLVDESFDTIRKRAS